MSSSRRTLFVLALALAFLCPPLLAQPTASASSNKSPVALFRDLLAMTPDQREKAIASRPPGTQKRILEKLNEYEIMPNELRDLRLRETELRWFLRPLMDEPQANRTNLLAQVPQELRGEVEQRLQLWDLLPPPLQDEWRGKDLIASYFAQTRSDTPEQLAAIMRLIPPARRQELEKGLDRWQAMSEEDRQKALAGFNKFFELTPEQQEKTLDTVSDEERRQMEQTLAAYGNLTPAQRAQCINSFEKFAQMNVVERQEFLKNAERWSEMTPEEREKWRQLVTVAPIMPTANPGSRPPGRSWLPATPDMATN
jgi:hypothetical protein